MGAPYHLNITELDAAGLVVTTQAVVISTPFAVPSQGGMSSVRPVSGGQQSAPFQPNTAMLLLVPDAGSQAIINWGSSPEPVSCGSVITSAITLAPGGARLAVL
jgi:hypothetical protein